MHAQMLQVMQSSSNIMKDGICARAQKKSAPKMMMNSFCSLLFGRLQIRVGGRGGSSCPGGRPQTQLNSQAPPR